MSIVSKNHLSKWCFVALIGVLISILTFIPNQTFSTSECSGADIIVIIDESSSMSSGSGSHFEAAKTAANSFADNLLRDVRGHRVGVIFFDEDIGTAPLAFSPEYSTVSTYITSQIPGGGLTNLKVGPQMAKNMFDNRVNPNTSADIIVMLSDGEHTTGGFDTWAATAFKEGGGTIFTIGFNIAQGQTAETQLQAIASDPDSTYYYAASPQTLHNIYSAIAVLVPSLDQDNDGHLTDRCASACPTGAICDDKDDQNKYVNPQVMEGLCKDANNIPITCPSSTPTLLSQPAWQVGSKQYANCRDYYADSDPSDASASVTCVQNNSTVRPFYTCNNYLSSARMRSTNAVTIDNNQLPGGNLAETSCPKEGGLVPCGRYSDDPITANVDESQPCGFCSFFQLFDRILSWIMWKIVPAVAVFIVVLGGFLLIISRGNPTQATLGKNAILYTFIGYAVMLVAWLLLNSAFAGIGVKRWTGLAGEEVTIKKTYGNLIWADRDDLDNQSFDGLALRITKASSAPHLVGKTKVIKKIWNKNEVGPNQNSDCPDSNGDSTGQPTGSDTLDCIETYEDWSDGILVNGDKIQIGGWWQFSCGQ